MAENIRYRFASQGDSPAWEYYVDCHPRRTIAHRWEWWSILANSFGVKPRYAVAECGNKLVGVLPTVLMSSILFGRYMISMPWLDYGGPLADNDDIACKLIEFAVSQAEREKCKFVELRAVRQVAPGLVNKDQKYAFWLDLKSGEENVWKSIDGKAKNQVRKAAKSGLVVQFGGIELLDEFYRIFSCNMRDLGTPVWPKKLYSEQFHYFKNDIEIGLVKLGDLPVAAAILLHYKDCSIVPSASSYRKYRNLNPNNLLYWEIIRHCIMRGSATFDFGRSSLNAGTYNFKKQWVNNPIQQIWQYKLLTIDSLPELDPSNPKFRLAINIWKHLPLFVANKFGPMIVTKLP
ncbi:MAG TPA: FemAB family PEP-CTERM system-associated protein [candidate division Zixibacteria bacterium]|jgi:serine/alanine adding enzyme|nr:FemAB family PEP-CTERM system-associated protein [candidate division Zixibacteria bacterium]HBZ00113.1 FemAB family PEP-CTERM system-associated protein [candidate division Zixibacteria bacterium]